MKVITVSSWEEYQAEVNNLKALRNMAAQNEFGTAPLLFRGQGNSKWDLDTTLDRYTKTPVSLQEYFKKLQVIKLKIETFTEQSWEFNLDDAIAWSGNLPFNVIPGYEYMVFLRHHGFPSPLLDWSESPQVAAFFAFRDPPKTAEYVSIFAFCKTMDGITYSSSNSPAIYTYGPNIKSHPRHFLQQSNYTICTVFKDTTQYFASHQEVKPVENISQDYLWRIDVPVSERRKALTSLGEFNLNSFSLFGSTESLLETLALQNFGEYF